MNVGCPAALQLLRATIYAFPLGFGTVGKMLQKTQIGSVDLLKCSATSLLPPFSFIFSTFMKVTQSQLGNNKKGKGHSIKPRSFHQLLSIHCVLGEIVTFNLQVQHRCCLRALCTVRKWLWTSILLAVISLTVILESL